MQAQCGWAKYRASVILVENLLSGDLICQILIRVIWEEGRTASAKIALVCALKVWVGYARIGYEWIQMLIKHKPNGKADKWVQCTSQTSKIHVQGQLCNFWIFNFLNNIDSFCAAELLFCSYRKFVVGYAETWGQDCRSKSLKVSKRGPIQIFKTNGFPFFFAQNKNLTPMQVEI